MAETPSTVSGWFEPAYDFGDSFESPVRRFWSARGGHLRGIDAKELESSADVIVPAALCERFGLRGGELVVGVPEPRAVRVADAPLRLGKISTINGRGANEYLRVTPFENLFGIEPYRQLSAEVDGGPIAGRFVDLFAPIGSGQSGLVVGERGTGKSTLLQQIAAGLAANRSDLRVLLLLVDELPEEITNVRRTVSCEVLASGSDRPAREHVRLARLTLERAKRMVELGDDVVLLVDSLTSLARAFLGAYDLAWAESGEPDPRAIDETRAFSRAACAIDDGGSLTVIGTLTSDVDDSLDGRIAAALRGNATLRIRLAPELAAERIWPAIDVPASTSEKDTLLATSDALEVATKLRLEVEGATPLDASKRILEQLEEYEDNAALIAASV